MKIVIVHNRYQQPGGEDVVFEQETQLLRNHGHEVVTYERSNWELQNESSALDRVVLPFRIIWSRASRRDFARLLDREKPQLVHVHNTFVMVTPSIFSACRERGIPVVQTLHNFRLLCPVATFFRNGGVCEECLEGSLLRSVFHGCYRDSRSATAAVALMVKVHRMLETYQRSVNSFVALTNFSRTRFIAGGVPAEKVFVKPNFVNPDPGNRTDIGDYALFVGRLSPEKRVNTLLAAWRLLKSKIPLVVIGGGPQRSELEAEAVGSDLSHVKFMGHISRQETLMAMNNARFLIFPSEWYENFPVTIAESFACRAPVICSRLGAMQEIVTDQHTGLHFSPGNAQELADKIEWAWNHPEQIREMGNCAREEFLQKYTADKNYPLLMNIYQQTLTANA